MQNVPNNNDNNVRQDIVRLHRGPLPSAEQMEKYERISPGAFDRIFNMAAERQQFDHEEKMSTIAASQNRVDKTYRNAMVAMPMAFMLCFSLIVAGVYLIITGHSLAGTLFGTPAFIAVLRYFLGPVKLSKNKDRPPVNNQDNNK